MNQEQIWQDLQALPPAARQQAADFIAFLRSRYTQSENAVQQKQTSLQDEPFFGIWQDNKEMDDSSTWVRQTRQREWH